MVDVIETIGTGGDYADPIAWEAATDLNLVSLGQRRIGDMLDEEFTFETNEQCFIAGATVNASFHRILRNQTGSRYNPYLNTGARIYKKWGGAGFDNCIVLGEDYVQLRGFGIYDKVESSVSSGSPLICIRVDNGNCSINSIYMRMAWCAAATTTGYGIEENKSPGDARTLIYNCIVEGNELPGWGLHRGFVVTGDNDLLFNSLAYNVDGYGIQGGVNTEEIRNCMAVGNKDPLLTDIFVFGGTTFTNNISGDSSASASGGIRSYWNMTPEQLWVNPIGVHDFRNIFTSPAVNGGMNRDTYFSNDFTGKIRQLTWEIGPYDGWAALPLNPTVVVETIGPGGDHVGPNAWESATRADLIYQGSKANTIQIGEIIDPDEDFPGSTIKIEGAVTDDNHYRVLRATGDFRYNPITDTGARLTGAYNRILHIQEQHCQISGIKFTQNENTATDGIYAIHVRARGVFLDSCWVDYRNGTGNDRVGIKHNQAVGVKITNCLVFGGNTTGPREGFDIGQDCVVYNCIVNNVAQGTGVGFNESGSLEGEFVNCIAVACDTCFNVDEKRQSHNCSSDTTAKGPGSITNKTIAEIFVDVTARDYHLTEDSPCLDAGENLQFRFPKQVQDAPPKDFANIPREAPWDMGIYEGFGFVEETPVFPIGQHMRLNKLWEMKRLDGYVLRLTDHNRQIIARGAKYSPASGIESSAVRKELGLRDHSVTYRGAISSDKIKKEDVRSGRWCGAVVKEYTINAGVPFAGRRNPDTYRLGRIKATDEFFEAEALGMVDRIDRRLGLTHERNCIAELGDDDCRADISADTQVSVAVASVSNRRKFRADTGDIPGSYADDYFQYGWLRWISGDNIGFRSVCKFYTSSTREIELVAKLPFDIQVGDLFNIEPGCNKLSGFNDANGHCVNKFNNGKHYQGYAVLSPNTDKTIQTPQR